MFPRLQPKAKSLEDATQSLEEPHVSGLETVAPVYLRLAYTIFFFVQMIFAMLLLFRQTFFNMQHGYLSLSWVAPATLGVVFFAARAESLKTDVGRSSVSLFLLHNVASLLLTVYNQFGSCRNGIGEGILFHVNITLQLFWVICGTLAIRNLFGYP
jgi:hypothetical protein